MDIQHKLEALSAKIKDPASTEAEVLEATRKLFLLQQKYKETFSSVDDAKSWQFLCPSSNLFSWQKYLLHLIADHCYCPMRYHDNNVQLYGTSAQLSVAKNLFRALDEKIQLLRNKNDSYCKGLVFAMVQLLPVEKSTQLRLEGSLISKSRRKRKVNASFLSGVRVAQSIEHRAPKEISWKSQ